MAEEDLASFLAVAEDLKIDGLIGKYEEFPDRKSDTESIKSVNADVLDINQDTLKEKIQVQLESEDHEELSFVTESISDKESSKQANLMTFEIFEREKLDDGKMIVDDKLSLCHVDAVQDIANDYGTREEIKPKPEIKHTISLNKDDDRVAITKHKRRGKEKSKNTKEKNNLETPFSSKDLSHKPWKLLPRCPICNLIVPTNYYLQHMRAKRESQCKDCKLFFGNCHSLAIHKKGRCRIKI